jgi:LmbE family N-acetylglucosaminyl deacetylase
LIPKGGQNIWVLAPHPDDEVAGCAFAMMRHAIAGDRVTTIFVTDGRRSRACGLEPDEMAQRRRLEAEESQRALGLGDCRWLDLPEGQWCYDDVLPALKLLSQERTPDIIYASSRIDLHWEHLKVARSLAQFLDETGLQPVIRIVQIQVPLTSVLTNLLASGEGLDETARAARAAYRTQVLTLEPTQRMRSYAGAFYRCGSEAEEYWQVSAESYRILHQDDVDTWAKSGFDRIRYRPWMDPLRFARGRSERRRLRTRAFAPRA